MNVLSLGAGTMARALLFPIHKKAREQHESINFCLYSPGQISAMKLAKDLQGSALADLQDSKILQDQDYYFVCCKPQQFGELASGLRGRLNPDSVVVSILAGVSLNTLHFELEHSKIIRLMPNTPAVVGAGIILFLANAKVENEKCEKLAKILSCVGKVFKVRDEDQLDRLTGYTGSGPAYFFELARLLSEQLKSSCSISSLEAQELVIELVWGAAKMMKQSCQSPEELRVQVTSPGGVTLEALKVLERGGLGNLFKQALEANYRRAKELASQKD